MLMPPGITTSSSTMTTCRLGVLCVAMSERRRSIVVAEEVGAGVLLRRGVARGVVLGGEPVEVTVAGVLHGELTTDLERFRTGGPQGVGDGVAKLELHEQAPLA